jgi:hypothetical protein
MGPELTARLGLNKDKYSRGLQEAERDFRSFTSNTRESGKGAAEVLVHSFRGVHEALKAFGAVAVIREFIDQFKELSEYAAKFGDRTDENVRAAIRWGDAYKEAGKSIKDAGVQALGFLSRAGEGWGAIGRMLMGDSAADIQRAHSSEDDALAAEAAKDKLYKANDPEKVKQLRRELADMDKRDREARETSEQRVAGLEQEQARILKERAELGAQDIVKRLELEKELRQVAEEFTKISEKQDHEAVEAAEKKVQREKELKEQVEARVKKEEEARNSEEKHISELQAKLNTAQSDRSRLTLSELANLDKFSPGVSIEMGEKGDQAREALGLKRQADQLRLSGDQAGAAAANSRYDAIVDQLTGPGGPLRSTEASKDSELAKEIATSNDLLGQINASIGALTHSD